MKKVIAADIDVLSALSRDYFRYGESVYSTYKTGMSKIERELESIRRNYKDYRNVTNKIHELQKRLKEIEAIIKNVNDRAVVLSKDLYFAAGSYAESNEKEKRKIKELKSRLSEMDKLPICTKSKNTGSILDNFFDKVIENANLVAGIKQRLNNTLSDFNYDLSEIMKQFVSNPQDCLELIKKVLVKIDSTVQDEWDYFYKMYLKEIKKLQKSFSDFGFNVNLEALTDIQLEDVINYIMKKRDEQEDDGIRWVDPGRMGRMWDALWDENFPLVTIISPALFGDFATEFILEDYGFVDKDTYREWRHHVLSAAGFIPKIGPLFGFMDAMIYGFREGEWVDAYLSAGLSVPSFGKFAGLWDLAEGADKILDFVDGLSLGTGVLESILGQDDDTTSFKDTLNNTINNVLDSVNVGNTIIDYIKDSNNKFDTFKEKVNSDSKPIINGIKNTISDISIDIIKEASQIAPSDYLKLPQLVNVTVNDAINTEWNGFMSNVKNIQNSVMDFVF